MADVASTYSTLQGLHAAMTVVQAMNLTAWRYSSCECDLKNGTIYDFIIVGGGTSGNVLGNRLSANSSYSVLILEAGGYPPHEADEFPGLFPFLTRSIYDYDFVGQNDNRTSQNTNNKTKGLSLTAGKMLGGSHSLHHMMYTRGFPSDYDDWADLLDDDRWKYENCEPHFKKFENIIDSDLLASTKYTEHFGTDGIINLSREPYPIYSKYLEAFKEIGHETEEVTTKLGHAEPLYTIGDGLRQSSCVRHLSLAKSRTNLCLALFTKATKIIIENGVAVGVEVITSNGVKYMLYARKEVVVSGGAINSPKLLLLSGFGPESHLTSKGIETVADLPVGQNLQDHQGTSLFYKMNDESTTPATASNPHTFGLPALVGTVAIDNSQADPQYQVVSLIIPKQASGLLMMCVSVFKYSDEICQEMYEANKESMLLWAVLYILAPKSRGQVRLASADPADEPLVNLGTLSDDSDLELLAKSLKDYHKVANSTYFKSVNASLMDFGFCSSESDEDEYWKCKALAFSNTLWHYCGTCPMGDVLDSSLRVKGVKGLRVVDASSMPGLVKGKTGATVLMLAEKAADMMLSDWGIEV